MTLRSTAAAIVLFTVTGAFGQENAPASTHASSGALQATRPPIVTHRWGTNTKGNAQSGPVNEASLQQRVEDLQATVDKMHAVLKQMRVKSPASAKAPMAQANLQMWELTVAQLDKQLNDLKLAEASRATAEARRAAMYKQAEIESQTGDRSAQQVMFSQPPTGTASPATAGAGGTAQSPTVGQTPNPASPNVSASPTTSSSPN